MANVYELSNSTTHTGTQNTLILGEKQIFTLISEITMQINTHTKISLHSRRGIKTAILFTI